MEVIFIVAAVAVLAYVAHRAFTNHNDTEAKVAAAAPYKVEPPTVAGPLGVPAPVAAVKKTATRTVAPKGKVAAKKAAAKKPVAKKPVAKPVAKKPAAKKPAAKKPVAKATSK